MSDSASPAVLGIDIGGTWVRVGVVRGVEVVPGGLVEPRLADSGEPGQLARQLADAVAYVSKAAALGDVAGVALPGIWDRQTTVMERALNLPRLEGVNLRELFEGALKRRVVLETDVNAAAWAHWSWYSPRPGRFVYLSVGTGVGGAVVLDGRLVRHTRGGGGHFGHLIVDTSPEAPVCPCGARGCLEAVAGGAAMNRMLHEEYKQSRRTGAVPEPDVFARAARGLAIGAMQIANIYAPDVIALGGGVIEHDVELVAEAARLFKELRGGLPPADLRIEEAPLLNCEAGVIGAALLAMQAGQ